MGKTDFKRNIFWSDICLITDTFNNHSLDVFFIYAGKHIFDMGCIRAPERFVFQSFFDWLDLDLAIGNNNEIL